jgi:D-alanine transaminase
MITSTTKEIYPVTKVNEHQIGAGYGGPIWEQLNLSYHQLVEQSHD